MKHASGERKRYDDATWFIAVVAGSREDPQGSEDLESMGASTLQA